MAIRTFPRHHFRDLRLLQTARERLGLAISCCIPTLNEEETVAAVVSMAAAHPLIDEVVVVDSASEDDTRARAAAAGARVFLASAIHPELPAVRGKGENLWRSLHIARGDIILHLDADLRRPSPRLISGLCGPLLLHPELHYVKAAYQRGDHGGRVTELLVKPLFRRFFPPLAALGQPLAGEFAARRTLLESLPFPVGYSVETTHLIDVLAARGPEVLAQVELGSRRHRRRPLGQLGAMSDEILASVLQRLGMPASGAPVERPSVESLRRERLLRSG